MTEYIMRETCYPGAIKQEIVGELVRCKDCKYFDQAEKYCCDFLTAEEDGFCKWGERREDDAET